MTDKVFELDALATELAARRKSGERIVQCHGCFDIVHPGHIRYLRFARSLGDKLVVSVSADDVVAKGAERPYIPESLRLENLAALEFVDYVCLSRDEWAGPVLELLRPDVYVKGKEYESNQEPRFARERAIVEAAGGEVVFGSGDVVFSSTEIIKRHGERFGIEPHKVRAFCHAHGIDSGAMDDLLRRCAGQKLVVLGDPILDCYVHCDDASAASEGPILDVTPVAEDWYVGGAGLVARQLAALGADVSFVTVASPSPDVDRMQQGLQAAGVSLELVEAEARPVIQKSRYLVAGQKLFKVNRGLLSPVAASVTNEILRRTEAKLVDGAALVVTDFGYGLFGDLLCSGLTELCATHEQPYYADVSTSGRANLLKFRAPRLATPTEKELRFALADTESGLSNLASRYYRQSGAQRLMVTLGRRGALYFRPPAGEDPRLRTAYLPALEALALDAVGAGDVFLAGAALADLSGAPAEHGMYLASAAAALAVGRVGNDPVGLAALTEYLEARPDF